MTNQATQNFNIDQAIEKYINDKNANKETLQTILVYFFQEYETTLSRNNAIFAKLMRALDSERKQVILWINRHTTFISCNKDYAKIITSDCDKVVDNKGIVHNVFRLHLTEDYQGQKWYDEKPVKTEKDFTMDDFRKAVENLKKKAEKHNLDATALLKI